MSRLGRICNVVLRRRLRQEFGNFGFVKLEMAAELEAKLERRVIVEYQRVNMVVVLQEVLV